MLAVFIIWSLCTSFLQNFQAAFHSFLPDDEKAELIAELRNAYGMIADPKHLSSGNDVANNGVNNHSV